MIYLLDNSTKPRRWLDETPYIEDGEFRIGQSMTVKIPTPLEYTLKKLNPDSADHAPFMPEYFARDYPLFRDDFIEALKAFGVKNMELYEASIHDPDNGKTYKNYRAFNVAGVLPMLVLGADVTEEEDVVDGSGFDVEADTKGLSLFRIENSFQLFVDERLKDHLSKLNFEGITFLDPRKCAL